MRKTTVILLFLALFQTSYAQQTQGVETNGLRFNFMYSPAKVPLDGGEIQVLDAQPMVGVVVDVNVFGLDLSPGLYLLSSIELGNGDESNYQFGIAAQVQLYKFVGIGFWYDFLKEGSGIEGIGKSNSGLLATVDFKL